MKTRISFLLLAAGVLLASCSKNENEGGEGPVPGQPVAIRLSAGIDAAEAESKASVTTSATVRIEGWEGAATPNYATAASKWNSTSSVTVNSTAAAITLSPAQYYNADGISRPTSKDGIPPSLRTAVR